MAARIDAEEEIPMMQRVLDSPFLLLFACIIVMFGFYTVWGLIELSRLPQAPLP